MTSQNPDSEVIVIDSEERIDDFYIRHGGRGQRPKREGDRESRTRGWWEIYAADGHKLRCEWSTAGTKTQMSFAESPPPE
jgi:hypothetical protein